MEIKKIKLPFRLKLPVLALGGQAKNTICFARDDAASISPVHADLGILKDCLAFEKDVRYYLKHKPAVIAFDLHPEYQSSKFGLSLSARYRLAPIQHHHAHIAACMVENGLSNQKVIGVAFDGTGLGADGTLWGAEFLVCDYHKFQRRAHLKEIPLIGGEKAILEPWRLLIAWLNFPEAFDKSGLLKKIYQRRINSPLASSMGRLFDAVGSLILGKREARFEAELAIGLEKLAEKNNLQTSGYKIKLIQTKDGYILDPRPIFKQIMHDLKVKCRREVISWRFHRSVAEMIARTCLVLRKRTKVNKVVLSGGVFQNKILLKQSLDLLYKSGFRVFTHKYLSCNDMCISLGQAVIAGAGVKLCV